jgi:hypothetical protein
VAVTAAADSEELPLPPPPPLPLPAHGAIVRSRSWTAVLGVHACLREAARVPDVQTGQHASPRHPFLK